jgi:transcriptional regulator with XRE-family HTH domain
MNTKNKHMEYSEWLKSARAISGFTLMGLAEKAGISHATIQRLESGDRFPSRGMVLKIAEAMGKSADDALFSAGFLPDRVLEIITDEDEAQILSVYRGGDESMRRALRGIIKEFTEKAA